MRREGAAPSTWLFMLVVAAAVSVAVLTGWMVNVVLPLMRAEFGVSAAHVGWVVTGYALAYAAGEYPTGDNDFTGTSKWVELQTGDDDHRHHVDPAQIIHYAMTRQ
jgi:hypothetical protein